MRDVTQDIITNLKLLLDNLVYDGTKFPVVEILANAKTWNYVWIHRVSSTSEGTKDKNIQRVNVTLEIVASGSAQRGYLTAINDISDQVLQLLDSLTSDKFFVVIEPELISYEYVEEQLEKENQTIIIDRKTLIFETLIQEQWK